MRACKSNPQSDIFRHLFSFLTPFVVFLSYGIGLPDSSCRLRLLRGVFALIRPDGVFASGEVPLVLLRVVFGHGRGADLLLFGFLGA